jgi:hypothetical protein
MDIAKSFGRATIFFLVIMFVLAFDNAIFPHIGWQIE